MGLVSEAYTFNATDTMGSHAGWTEVTDYSEATRPAVVFGEASGASITNGVERAAFTFNAEVITSGAFLCIGSNVKGAGDGILFGEGAFSSGNHSAISGDKCYVTVTTTAVSL